ncbi:MAG: hypothetical protein P8N76_22730 [Pirellulaceae bacterium]|nr:hypothetical protein [Pirellulaceae bacterium]
MKTIDFRWLTVTTVLLVCCAKTPTVLANVGPGSTGGHLVGEPVGIEAVAITREMLAIDLRPLADDRMAQVEVVYQLQNEGESQDLDLLFAVGAAGIAGFQVWLDDEPITTVPARDAKIPDSWKAPESTPGIESERPLIYHRYGQATDVVPMEFSLTIPPAVHTLTVRYEAEATTNFEGYPTVYRQLAYVLAPARSWAGFGGLDVRIQFPESWEIASTLDLLRENDTLVGSFDSLPGDAIGLTVQAPKGWAHDTVLYGSLALLGVILLGGAISCWRVGRILGRRRAKSSSVHLDGQPRRSWPWSVGIGVVWSVAILGVGSLALAAPFWVLPAFQATRANLLHHLAFIGVLIFSGSTLLIGIVLSQATATLTHNRESPRKHSVGTVSHSREAVRPD